MYLVKKTTPLLSLNFALWVRRLLVAAYPHTRFELQPFQIDSNAKANCFNTVVR